MIRLLSRWLIPDRDNVSSPAVRRAYGTLCGAVGIALNILLFIGKFFAGQLSGSIAVTADAFNNLSDAGSSAVTLLGFRLAGKKPDTDHPFGHGRIEYISGLIVAGLILLMGVELAKSSFDKGGLFYIPEHLCRSISGRNKTAANGKQTKRPDSELSPVSIILKCPPV